MLLTLQETARAAPAPEPGWDVAAYTLEVRVDADAARLAGAVTLDAVRVGDGPLVLHADGLDNVALTLGDGTPLTPTVEGDEVRLDALEGDAVTVRGTWTAELDGTGAVQLLDPAVWTRGGPASARTWLLLHDDPADRATVDWTLWLPDDRVVAAVGAATGQLQAAGYVAWQQRIAWPILPDQLRFAAGPYVAVSSEGSPPLDLWTEQAPTVALVQAIEATPAIVAFYEGEWGAFPFERLGLVVVPGAVVDPVPTAAALGEDVVAAPDLGDAWARTVAAQWWGGEVGYAGEGDAWGVGALASYGQVRWAEYAGGEAGLQAALLARREAWLASPGPPQALAGQGDPTAAVVRDKGALVLHMLRWMLGDDAFFDGVRAFHDAGAFASPGTAELRAAWEAASGQDLSGFFAAYVDGAAAPAFRWGYAVHPTGGGTQVDLEIAQHEIGGLAVPVPVELDYLDGTTEALRVDVDGFATFVSLCRPGVVVDVRFDPDGVVVAAGTAEATIQPASDACHGVPTDDEPAAGDTAAPIPPPECGCGAPVSSPGAAGVLALVVAGLAPRRRR